MSPEEKELLEKSLTLAEDNHKMLKALTWHMQWTRVTRWIYWVLIVGSAVGAYYFIQPYIDQVLGIYGSTKSNIENVNSFFEGFKDMPR